jgi:FKBP-type peptidyl-prolyl cis-trans isomerase SlyD
MTIDQNKVVSIDYELWVDNGDGERTFQEKTGPGQPLVFLFGVGQLLPLFEDQLKGKQSGDPFEFSIDFENGYGDYDENLVKAIPRSVFTSDPKNRIVPVVGKVIPMKDQDGNPLRGEVVKVEQDLVYMDFNHPMAGFDLYFTGKVLEVREASPEEITHGHVHGPGGHHH